jgi:uncharacterized membrane protein
VPLRLALSALALLVLAPLAFWPAYLSKLGAADAYTHAHAVLGTCWLLLLFVQPLLIKASYRSTHRLLGRVGVTVGVAFFISGLLLAHRSVARMSMEQFSREGRFVYLPLAMAAIFAAALFLAVQWRHSPPVHGRFMAATALALLDPLFARLLFFYAPALPAEALYQVPAFALSLAILLAMLLSLPNQSAGRPAFSYFAAGVAIVLLGFFVIPGTAPWLSFATWFRGLPLT